MEVLVAASLVLARANEVAAAARLEREDVPVESDTAARVRPPSTQAPRSSRRLWSELWVLYFCIRAPDGNSGGQNSKNCRGG